MISEHFFTLTQGHLFSSAFIEKERRRARNTDVREALIGYFLMDPDWGSAPDQGS